MRKNLRSGVRGALPVLTAAGVCVLLVTDPPRAGANPNSGGASVSVGAATFNNSGSHLTINQTTPNVFINWPGFNIGAGETTTFVQPSSSSVAWNYISDPGASIINGNLNANGYVVLQNPNGFSVGGSAAISTHGLIMTTASSPDLDLSSGAWSFTAPPPTAKIINYGQINISGGGSAFLIASDIQNKDGGTISAPGGTIGLYAGKTVLVSSAPDGRGLSAKVTLPQGSVDNEGRLVADGGKILAQAKMVNQSGFIQANSVQNVNGTIELVASDTLDAGANSSISAKGDPTASSASPGGFVVLDSSGSFADAAGSTISVSGAAGGQNGIVEIFGAGTTADSLHSSFDNPYALLLNPVNLTLSTSPTAASSSNPNLNLQDLSKYSLISLSAQNLELASRWTLADQSAPATLSLSAMNNITLDATAGISAGNNWNVNLTAGTALANDAPPASGQDGIYLNGSSFIQTRNGDISVWTANEVQLATGPGFANGIRTLSGGNIDITAVRGDINTGSNPNGYSYLSTAPYSTVSTLLGGISTAAGGNVTITAGGDVTSYNPTGSSVAGDAGTGAFGSQPGDVTITAGGSVYGHYVLGNGRGTITAGRDAGVASGANSFALSLTRGSWDVNAPNGNVYLQEVRNPNGIFNESRPPLGSTISPGRHLFTYDPEAAVDLTAGIGVYLTGVNVPRPSGAAGQIPVLYPSILNVTAGSGGVTLENDVTLFPSEQQNLEITTLGGGSFTAPSVTAGTGPELLMSDSGQKQWVAGKDYFTDHDLGAASAVEPAGLDPVQVDISGDMKNVTLVTTKATEITVGGDMIDCGFSGQNLHAAGAGSKTSITVGGQIYNRSAYAFANDVHIPAVPAEDLLPGMSSSWDSIFFLALDPAKIAGYVVPGDLTPVQYAAAALQAASLFGARIDTDGQVLAATKPKFTYNAATGRLGFQGQMSQPTLQALTESKLTILQLVNGVPVTYVGTDGNRHFKTTTVSWADPSVITAMYQASLGAPDGIVPELGYHLGGPGEFDINAGSISLGNTLGIVSCGTSDLTAVRSYNRYNNLASITMVGAAINVNASGNINMLTSDIATLGGGDINISSTGGSMDLGAPELGGSPDRRDIGYGVFSALGGNVNVTALGNVDVNGSRIATLNGGAIHVQSLEGDVNAGTGGASRTKMVLHYVDPETGEARLYNEYIFGGGILAFTVVEPDQIPNAAAQPGDITIETPRGNIIATVGGILQESLSGNVAPGPKITLAAGTPPVGEPGDPDYVPGYEGNIDLGQSGVIGGNVKATANGNITGLVISRQNSDINAAQNFNGTVLAGGQASLNASTVSGSSTVIGVGGVNVSGILGSGANVLGQNVSVNGGASQSTLGSSANVSSAGQAAAQQATQSAAKQVASNDNSDDDEKKKKKKKDELRRVGRVTVILPGS